MVKGFNQFINEAEGADPEMFKTHKEALDDLLKLGLVSKKEYQGELRRIAQDFAPEKLVSLAPPAAQEALSSPEMKPLQDAGLMLLSSKTQIQRGNLVIGRPDYDRLRDHALGFFPDIRKVRRMTPKAGRLSPFGGYTHIMQDATIKIFPKEWSDLEFYRRAMRWVADHVDLTNPEFPVKVKTRKGYFDAPLD